MPVWTGQQACPITAWLQHLTAAWWHQAKRQKRVLEEDEYDLDDDFIDDQDADDEVEESGSEGEGRFYVYQVQALLDSRKLCSSHDIQLQL